MAQKSQRSTQWEKILDKVSEQTSLCESSDKKCPRSHSCMPGIYLSTSLSNENCTGLFHTCVYIKV